MSNQDEAGCKKGPASGHLLFLRSPTALSVDLSLVSCGHYPSCVSISNHSKGVGVLGSPSTSHQVLHMAGKQASRHSSSMSLFLEHLLCEETFARHSEYGIDEPHRQAQSVVGTVS